MGTEDRPTDEMELGGRQAAAAVADGPLLVSGRRLGERYRLERPLGHGGMASVWLATDERLDRPVAIKVLSDTLAHDDEYLDRFRREAHVAAGLQHPNLVSIYDFEADERPFLVMEYISGGDLGERVEAGDVPDAEPLARELLGASPHPRRGGAASRHQAPERAHRLGRSRAADRLRDRAAARCHRSDQDRSGDRHRVLPCARGQGGRARERARRPLRARGGAGRCLPRGRRREPLGAHRPVARSGSRAPSPVGRERPRDAGAPVDAARADDGDAAVRGHPRAGHRRVGRTAPAAVSAVPDRGPGARQAAHDDRGDRRRVAAGCADHRLGAGVRRRRLVASGGRARAR